MMESLAASRVVGNWALCKSHSGMAILKTKHTACHFFLRFTVCSSFLSQLRDRQCLVSFLAPMPSGMLNGSEEQKKKKKVKWKLREVVWHCTKETKVIDFQILALGLSICTFLSVFQMHYLHLPLLS